MWWSLIKASAGQPLSGHQFVFVFEGGAEPRGYMPMSQMSLLLCLEPQWAVSAEG
jgi:hypothetical protein